MKLFSVVLVLYLSALSVGAQQTASGIRHSSVVRAFMKQSGYPKGRPGFVVDHRIPLCAGGLDTIQNMQWQERRESYSKDKYERALCRELKRQQLKLMHTEGKQ
jgi:hypothetical protein